MMGASVNIVVLGLGNLLRRDEGLGVRALERLRAQYELPGVITIDGGTTGLELLSMIEGVTHLLVLDAMLTEGPPGTLLRLSHAEVPAYFGIKTSPHEISIPDLLALAQLRGTPQRDVVMLGLQPATIELGWELSEVIASKLVDLVAAAVKELKGWGVAVTPLATIAQEDNHA